MILPSGCRVMPFIRPPVSYSLSSNRTLSMDWFTFSVSFGYNVCKLSHYRAERGNVFL